MRDNFHDRGAQTAFFAQIDLVVNVITLIVQLFFTGRIVGMLGVGLTLAILPALTLLGFGALTALPAVSTLVVFQVLRRSTDYAIARPTREVLYTVVPREDRYKAKSFIDTVVYRGGDQVGAWAYALIAMTGFGSTLMATIAIGLAAVWLINGLWLGRRQALLASREDNRAALQANSKMTASTARLSPGLALIFLTVPSISARRTFSIFIASTTATVSPALTSCPSLTAIDTTRPGIGHDDLLAGVARLSHRHQPRVAGLALGIDICARLDATVGQRKTIRDRAHLNGRRMAVNRSAPDRRARLPVRHDAGMRGPCRHETGPRSHHSRALRQAYFLLRRATPPARSPA